LEKLISSLLNIKTEDFKVIHPIWPGNKQYNVYGTKFIANSIVGSVGSMFNGME